jgi:hypothetical protein
MLNELLIVLVVLIVFAIAWHYLPQTNTSIIDTAIDGQKKVQSAGPQLTQFSYTCWIRLDKFDYGKPTIIFVKGTADLDQACPALLIDGNTNTLLIKLDTFGAQETIPITSVPAKKWLHVGITVQEHELKVYINGIEYDSKTLINLPKTNTARLITSPTGFSGRISNLQFYSRVLDSSEMKTASFNNPSTSEEKQIFPPYFSSSWFKT